MTEHEQPAAGVALKPLYGHLNYLKDPDGLAMIRQVLLEVRDWHDPAPVNCNSLARLLDTIEALRAPTDAGGAVSEAAEDLLREIFPPADLVTYSGEPDDVERSQWVTNGARRRVSALLNGSAPAPQAEGHSSECWGRTSYSGEMAHCFCKPSPQPLQQGGEVTRASGEKANAIMNSFHPQWSKDHEGEAALGWFIDNLATLAADRDKAVGLLRRWREPDGQWSASIDTDAFLSSQTEGR